MWKKLPDKSENVWPLSGRCGESSWGAVYFEARLVILAVNRGVSHQGRSGRGNTQVTLASTNNTHEAMWIDFPPRSGSVKVNAESKMTVSMAKTLAILGFLAALAPRAALTATQGHAVIQTHSPHHLKFHRSFSPGGQVEAGLPGTASSAEEKDVALAGPYRNLLPVRERAILPNATSCVVPAAHFVLVRTVSRNIFLSSLNL